MSLNNLKPARGSKFKKKRVGRGPGSGNGKTAGRGNKGAQSRSGYSYKRGFEGGQLALHLAVGQQDSRLGALVGQPAEVAAKGAADQIPENGAPHTAGFFGRADQRHALRVEDGVERLLIVTKVVVRRVNAGCS